MKNRVKLATIIVLISTIFDSERTINNWVNVGIMIFSTIVIKLSLISLRKREL